MFRIRVAYQREPQILREVQSPEGMISLRDTPASLRLERDTKHLPLLTSALHGYASFGLWFYLPDCLFFWKSSSSGIGSESWCCHFGWVSLQTFSHW